MPATYATEDEADTLEIDAIDAHTGALVTLFIQYSGITVQSQDT